jgi:hypothetical protein
MRAAQKKQPKTTEAIANELIGYDALLAHGGKIGHAADHKDMPPEGVFHKADIRHRNLANRRSLGPG